MLYKQNAVLTSLLRAQQFFSNNSSKLSGLNPSARKELDDVVDELSSLAVAQEGGKHGSIGETARNHALRLALRQNHLVPIAVMARYKLQSVPEFTALTLPPAKISAENLVASANSIADAATPHAQTFIDAGLSVTFLDDLRLAAQALSDSIVERGNLQGRRLGATAGLAAAEKRGRAMLRVLDALVLTQIGDDAQLHREWTTARAVQRKPGASARRQPVTAIGEQPAGPRLVPASAQAPTSLAPLSTAM